MDDDEAIEAIEVDNVVEASPWTNHDTAAAVFQYASAMSQAASEFFASMNRLALAQAGLDWKRYDKAEFASDADALIRRLTEDGDGDG